MPHTPLLLPSIGQDVGHKMRKIIHECENIAHEIYARHIDTLIIISDQPTMHGDAISINIKDPYTFDLKEFGDFGFEVPVRPDIMLIDRLQRSMRRSGLKISLNTDTNLSFSTAVPLNFFINLFPQTKLITISPPTDLDNRAIFNLGTSIKETLQESNKRIAIIAAGDLSHALNEDSPHKSHPDGQLFDQRINDSVQSKNVAGLLSLDDDIVKNAEQSIYNELLLLFGIFDKISIKLEHHYYDSPFGVGYLTAGFSPK